MFRRGYLATSACALTGLSGLAGCTDAATQGSGRSRWVFETNSPVENVAYANGTVFAGNSFDIYYLGSGGQLKHSYQVYEESDQVNYNGQFTVVDGGVVAPTPPTIRLDDQAESIWEIEEASSLPPAIANGRVYLATLPSHPDDERLVCIELETGEVLWKEETGHYKVPTVSAGSVFVGSDKGTIKSFDTATGDTLWSTSLDNPSLTSATVRDSMVYVAAGEERSTDNGQLVALNAATGDVEWNVSTGPVGEQHTVRPVIDDGMLYLASARGSLYAHDVEDGTKLWTFESTGKHTYGYEPVVTDEAVFHTTGKRLVSLDKATGKRRWSYEPENTIFSAPTTGDTDLYVGESSSVRALKRE